MTPLKPRELAAALKRKGFEEEGGDHVWLRLYIGTNRTYIRTKVSRGDLQYGDELLGQVAKRLHLSRSELESLIRCPLSQKDYAALMVERGHA